MFLSLTTIRSHKYLYLVESVHVPGRGSVRKILKSYGRWDKLPEDIRKAYEDKRSRKLLEEAIKEEYRQESINRVRQIMKADPRFAAQTESATEAESVAEAESSAGAESEVVAENAAEAEGVAGAESAAEAEDTAGTKQQIEEIMLPPLFYGHLVLRGIWWQDLDLRKCLYDLQRNKTKVDTWSFNDLLFYLCSRKIIDPASYLDAYGDKGNYFYCPWQNINQDNFYRGLDFLYDNRETILTHAVKSCMKRRGSEISVAFFDCTNTWFETPYDDIGWQVIRFTRDKRRELSAQGYSEEQIDAYIEGDSFRSDLAEALSLSEDQVLRMCGPSKEGRFGQPLVLMALAIDQTGMPIDCKVFAGNVAEVKTIEPMLDSLRDKYQVRDVYFVADRGLNSTKTLDQIENRGLGFIVAQKVSGQKKTDREVMMDLDGYRNCEFVNDSARVSEEPLEPYRFRFKVSEIEKTSFVENEDGGLTAKGRPRRRKLTVKCKVIYTWDPAREARDLKNLEEQIAKAQSAVENGVLMGNSSSSGWRALIQTQKEAACGEDKNLYRAVGLKQSVIDERRAVAGYAAYVYQHPENAAHTVSDLEVLATYHRLVGIEDCFRVMKSQFSLRPVYVRSKKHIVAHCYLCFLSLLLLRQLQFRLQEVGVELSAERITDTLRSAVLVPIPQSRGAGMDSDLMLLNIGLNYRFFTARRAGKGCMQQALNQPEDAEAVWNGYIKDLQAGRANDMADMLKAVGLKPLPAITRLKEAKTRLGLRTCRNSDIVCGLTTRLLRMVAAA